MYTMYITFLFFLMEPARLLGIIGLLLISWGVLEKKERRQDILFVCGGILLFCYSYWLGDAVFMVLQIVFTSASIYELLSMRPSKSFVSNMKRRLHKL
jgi:hypothetical protein